MGFLDNLVNGIKGVGNTLNNTSSWLRGLSSSIRGSSQNESAPSGQQNGPSGTGAGAPSTAPTQTPSTTPTQTPSGAPTQTPSTALSTTPTQTPSAAPEATAPSQGTTTPGGAPSGTPGTEAAPEEMAAYESNPYTSQYGKEGESGEEHIPTYEEFLMGNTAGYNHIRTEASAFYDEQAKKTLAALDEQKAAADAQAKESYDKVDSALTEQKTAADAHAKDSYDKVGSALDEQKTAADNHAAGQRDSAYGSLEAQKNEVYKYADEVLGESLGYNQQAYDAVVKLLGEELAAGKLNAEEAKSLLLSLAEETKKGVYDTAERQREEAHKNADIYRERANVDAKSAYAQNLAGYGANAEVLGRMGITGGGYGDWVNGNAYATQRAEVQAAGAAAEGAKREAIYTEDMLKLEADSEYNKQKGQAEFDYLERLYNLDSNYRTGMAEAEQTKAAADKAAQDTARDTKFRADSLEREGKAEADLNYSDMLYQNETDYKAGKLDNDLNYSDMLYQNDANYKAGKLDNDLNYSDMLYQNDANYKAGKLEAEQNRDEGKFQANMDYAKNIMQNDERIAEYMEKLKAGDEEAIRQQKEIFSQLLTGAANGKYGAEELKILANMFGFDESQTKDLVDSAGRYNTKVQAEKDEALGKEKTSNIIGLLDGANTGAYTAEQIPMLAKELGLDPKKDEVVIDVITKAAQAHQDGKSAEDTQYMNGIYADLMTAASSGSLDSEAIKALADMFGFTDEDEINALVDASTRRNDKIEAEKTEATENNRIENEMKLAMESGDIVGYIDKAIESGAISPEAGSRNLYNHFKDSLTAGNFDYDEYMEAVDSKNLSETDREKFEAEYNKSIDTTENFFKEDGKSSIDMDRARDLIVGLCRDPLASDDVKYKLGKVYLKLVGPFLNTDDTELIKELNAIRSPS